MLWLISDVAALAGLLVRIFEPDFLQQFLNTGELEGMQIGPETLLLLAILLLIPLVMAFLSVALKDSIDRWANIIVGIILFGFGLTDLPTIVAEPAYMILTWLGGVVPTVLIVWFAWKSKLKPKLSK